MNYTDLQNKEKIRKVEKSSFLQIFIKPKNRIEFSLYQVVNYENIPKWIIELDTSDDISIIYEMSFIENLLAFSWFNINENVFPNEHRSHPMIWTNSRRDIIHWQTLI